MLIPNIRESSTQRVEEMNRTKLKKNTKQHTHTRTTARNPSDRSNGFEKHWGYAAKATAIDRKAQLGIIHNRQTHKPSQMKTEQYKSKYE